MSEALSHFVHWLADQVMDSHCLIDALTEAVRFLLRHLRLAIVTRAIAEADARGIDNEHVELSLLLAFLRCSIGLAQLLIHIRKATRTILRHFCS